MSPEVNVAKPSFSVPLFQMMVLPVTESVPPSSTSMVPVPPDPELFPPMYSTPLFDQVEFAPVTVASPVEPK